MCKPLELLNTGGPVMYILTLIGFLIMLTGIRRCFWLILWSFFSDRYPDSGAPEWSAKALKIASQKKCFSEMSMLESLEVCFSRMEDCLTHSIPTLKFFAQISTLLGFLGTVTGMVRVFNTVARVGIAAPADLASGIHEALFTTVYGLILAIIAWWFIWLIETIAARQIRKLEVQIVGMLEETNIIDEKELEKAR